MSVRTVVKKPSVYFLTFTCHDWLPLIERSNGYDTVYNFFNVLEQKGHSVTGYVIMPNHIHLLLHFSGHEKSLNSLISNGKRFMAYEMLARLERRNELSTLNLLKSSVQAEDLKKGQNHYFWIRYFDVKECRTEKFLLQKLNYVHNNPVTGKWKLAASPADYIHSSASFYLRGKQQLFDVKDYRELLDWENMYS
jgi:REP element-mobilizing transposase RayT